MLHRRTLAGLCILCFCCAELFSRTVERTARWDELSSTISKQFVTIDLPDGTHLAGIGVGTEGDDLLLDVKRSSNKQSHPRGSTRIPRSQVSVIDLRLRRSGGHRGAAIGTAIGAAAGAPAAIYAGEKTNGGVAALILIAGAAAGWYIGHHFDADTPSHIRLTVAPAP